MLEVSTTFNYTRTRGISGRCRGATRHRPTGIIAPYALAMALVGLLESLMTAKLVDDITDTHSNKSHEAVGQGVANVVTGFFGGMGGCAMIGQTMINVKINGARTRISTFLAGSLLLALVVGLGDLVARIPMAALAAVMIMASVTTLDWRSINPKTLRHIPKSETGVMLSTVAVTVATANLVWTDKYASKGKTVTLVGMNDTSA